MPQVGAAAIAHDFNPVHHVTVVVLLTDAFFRDRSEKTGPAGSRIVFGIGAEQFVAAAGAPVNAPFMIVPVLAGEGLFGLFQAGNLVLFWRQLPLPFLFRFFYFS